jgi:hypothetical protein
MTAQADARASALAGSFNAVMERSAMNGSLDMENAACKAGGVKQM